MTPERGGAGYARPVSESAVSTQATESQTLPGRLWQRFGHLVREVGKFGIVGGLSFIVDTLILNLLLDTLGIWAKVVSTVVAATLAFLGNRFWTWRDRTGQSMRREYLLYFVFNAIGLALAFGCLWISHDLLGAVWPEVFHSRLADNVAAQIVGTGVGTVFRFWSYRTFVFAGPRVEPADALDATSLLASESELGDGEMAEETHDPGHPADARSSRPQG